MILQILQILAPALSVAAPGKPRPLPYSVRPSPVDQRLVERAFQRHMRDLGRTSRGDRLSVVPRS